MINVKIVTPTGQIFKSDKAERISLPTEMGVISVLADHEPLIALLKSGEIEIEENGHISELAVSTGMIQVLPKSKVAILAETADRPDDINLEQAKEARAQAQRILNKKSEMADVDYLRLQKIIERESARIRVATKYRKRREIRSADGPADL